MKQLPERGRLRRRSRAKLPIALAREHRKVRPARRLRALFMSGKNRSKVKPRSDPVPKIALLRDRATGRVLDLGPVLLLPLDPGLVLLPQLDPKTATPT